MSVEAQAYLAELGIDVLALGGAPIRTVRLACGHAVAEAPLPFEGVGLTRRTLDAALLRQAGAAARRPARPGRARGCRRATDRIEVRGGGGPRARRVLLATGKHDLGAPRRPSTASRNGLIGFKTYLTLGAAARAGLGGAVEVVLFEGGYAGLQAVEGGFVNLCLLVHGETFARAGGRWAAFLGHLCATSPHLRARLDGAVERPRAAALHRPGAYGFVHRGGPDAAEGLFRLGDQMGVIPSFAGDGIAIALHSAGLAAGAILTEAGTPPSTAACAPTSRARSGSRPSSTT